MEILLGSKLWPVNRKCPVKEPILRSTPRMAEHFVRLFTNLKKNPIGKQTLQAKVSQSTRVLQK